MWVYAMIPAGALLVCLLRFLNLASWVLSLSLILISAFLAFLLAFPFGVGEGADRELSEHRGDQTGAMDPSSHVRVVFVCTVRKHVHTHHVRRTARTDSAEAR
jgi:hypothetical protein